MDNLVLIFKSIFYMGISSTLIILIILLVKKIFNKTLTTKWHYYIWILLIIRLTTPFYVQGNVSVHNFLYPIVEKVSMTNKIMYSVQNSKVSFTDNKEKNTVNSISNKKILKVNKNYSSLWVKASYLWISVLILIFAYILLVNIFVTVKIKAYKESKDERINAILESCKNIMRVRKNIKVLSSKEARTPALYGLFSAKILVCEAYMKCLSDNEIKYVFLHELAHYKRKDIVLNWVIVILQGIYFFNPLIWYAFYKMREDCEVACDAIALKNLHYSEYKNYGKTVLKLLRLFSESNFIPLTAGISKNKSSYKRRIIMISNFKKRKFIFTVGSIVLIAIVACIGFIKINSLSDKSTKSTKVVVQKKAAPVKKTDNKVNKPDNTAVNSQVSDKAVAQNKQVNQPAPIKKSRVVQNELATVNTNKAVQPVKKVVTPPSNPTPPVKKVVTEESNVYVSKNLGIVMTFPESWSGKYSVEETSDYLDIYFNDHKNKGLLLLVKRNSPNLSGDGYDPIIDGKYVYRIGDNDYFIAGTTGVTVDDNQPDFKNFMQMHSELPQVINSMRVIK